jgi:hypothetical protein
VVIVTGLSVRLFSSRVATPIAGVRLSVRVFSSRVKAASPIAGSGLFSAGFLVVLIAKLSVAVFSWLVKAVLASAGTR